MEGSDPGEPDIAELFCHYNALYFGDSLGACAVSWAEDPLPSGDHGANFQKLMNTINLNSVPDPHRPVGGYSITTLHEIKKKYQYKCDSCGDLVKSIKIRGPSRNDCTESKGAYNSCQNTMCHWHRHKKQCSGSYCRVRKSSLGCAKLKGSEALAEETLDERKAEQSACGSWHAKHTSLKRGTSLKHEREDASAEFVHRTDDAVGNSGLDSSRNTSNKKIKLAKDIGFDLLTGTAVEKVPKRPRTVALKKNRECSRQKTRKISKWNGSYSVVIEWLHYYCVDESDEDEVPLINKRTERRKQQKLLKNAQATESSHGVWGASSSSHVINGRKDSGLRSCSQGPRDNDSFKNVPASSVEETLLPNPVISHGVARDQADHETVPTPLDSLMVGEIIDISDG